MNRFVSQAVQTNHLYQLVTFIQEYSANHPGTLKEKNSKVERPLMTNKTQISFTTVDQNADYIEAALFYTDDLKKEQYPLTDLKEFSFIWSPWQTQN